MEDLKFSVTLDPSLTSAPQDSVGYGLAAEYSYDTASEVYRDLLAGKALPLQFVSNRVTSDALIAATLFLHRDLVLIPRCFELVCAVDFVGSNGSWAMAHVGPRSVLRALQRASRTRMDQDDLVRFVTLVQEYVRFGTEPKEKPFRSIRAVDTGTNGFVVLQCAYEPDAFVPGCVDDGITLAAFGEGHLRGVAFEGVGEGRTRVSVFRKTPHVAFGLTTACQVLNDVEMATGEYGGWVCGGYVEDVPTSLTSPPEGTLLLPSQVLSVLLRV